MTLSEVAERGIGPTVVEVRSEDIEYGKRKDCTACPIALAIVRLVTERTCVKVSRDDVEMWRSQLDRYSLFPELPEEAREFIARFDKDLPVVPFSFELDIHWKFLRS